MKLAGLLKSENSNKKEEIINFVSLNSNEHANNIKSWEKAILFCWQNVLLFVLSFLSRPAIFVWGRTFW